MFDRLILGTAQLGLPYGIANVTGKPDQAEADAIVRAAWEGGIRAFDTAQGYGDSETVLGHALAACGAAGTAQVITKLPPQLPEVLDGVPAAIEASLRRLGVSCLHCTMLHREEHLSLLSGQLGEMLCKARERGQTQHIGVSVYAPEKAMEALCHPLVDSVQMPGSLFDRRFAEEGIEAEAVRRNKRLYIRSVFLQGVLCMEPERIPPRAAGLRAVVEELRRVCRMRGLEPAQAALNWMLLRHPQCSCLVGAETAAQVRTNLNYAEAARRMPEACLAALDAVKPLQDVALLDPRHWPKN